MEGLRRRTAVEKVKETSLQHEQIIRRTTSQGNAREIDYIRGGVHLLKFKKM